jgi:TatD DNase family protein
MYFDTHAHYDDPRFDADREETLAAVREAGVELVLVPGCDPASSRAATALAETHSWIYAAAGIHPQEAASVREEDYDAIRALLRHPRVRAVGEIGLDYYYDDAAPREVQREVFRRQLALAKETGLPAIVHDREAHGDCLTLIDEYPEVRGVFHCFSGSAEYARELVRRGWYISFTGSVTFKNARGLLLAAQAVPNDRIMIETDSPYLAPEPYRGRRNDSRGLRRICAVLAELRGMTPEALAELTLENGKRFFGI